MKTAKMPNNDTAGKITNLVRLLIILKRLGLPLTWIDLTKSQHSSHALPEWQDELELLAESSWPPRVPIGVRRQHKSFLNAPISYHRNHNENLVAKMIRMRSLRVWSIRPTLAPKPIKS